MVFVCKDIVTLEIDKLLSVSYRHAGVQMALKYTWAEETVQWMSMTMHNKNGSSRLECQPIRVLCLMWPVCPMENTSSGKETYKK
jgi:hypothetical protein